MTPPVQTRPTLEDDDLVVCALERGFVAMVRDLEAENAALREQVAGHCDRIAAQSEILSKAAEKPDAPLAGADPELIGRLSGLKEKLVMAQDYGSACDVRDAVCLIRSAAPLTREQVERAVEKLFTSHETSEPMLGDSLSLFRDRSSGFIGTCHRRPYVVNLLCEAFEVK